LLLEHTKIKRWNFPEDDSGFVFIGWGDYQFEPLPDAGRQIQSKVLEDFRHFANIIGALLKQQPQAVLDAVKESVETITKLIEQNPATTYFRNGAEAYREATQELGKMVAELNHLYDGSSGVAVFVPDVNALLHNPDLEKWEFAGADHFTLVFTPTVLQELDELKVTHRVETVRQKAEGLIKRIKEYQRRGKLSEGVPIVKGKIDCYAIAVEPDVGNSLPWLDKDNNDDRILASAIEIMRRHPRSPVVVVTRDINMQNKAGFAGVEFAEPPDPA
jgi:hypothetical protein